MSYQIVNACDYETKSCLNFKKVNKQIIEMVNNYYFDLQMYANFVFDIDNDKNNLSDKNNFYRKILAVQKKYDPEYPTMPLFVEKNMSNLRNLVSHILNIISQNIMPVGEYLSDIIDIHFFGSGAASSTILLKVFRKISSEGEKTLVMPLIVKLVPFQLPHHYSYLPSIIKNKQEFIWEYIESPGYALFLKEAWMYCFSKNELSKYTPTFNCISNCYIVDGFPIQNLDNLTKIYREYSDKMVSKGKKLPYKKWFNILLDPNVSSIIKKNILNADYGCFEMKEIEGTLDDLMGISNSIDLAIVFEYLYTKVVSAYIGRIIFTDDHFGNVAYITVSYAREYTIKCNGCKYIFYMPPGRMVQFIDLERYIFNYSRYDIYTNTALSNIPNKDYDTNNNSLSRIRNYYQNNNYIFDKSLNAFLEKSMGPNNFVTPEEYQIMLQIITSKFIHDIKTFCQIMETNLPQKYLTKPSNIPTHGYYLDLDDESLRIINLSDILPKK